MRRLVGIDPGLLGGLAVLDIADDGATAVRLVRTPVVVVRKGGKARPEYDVRGMLCELLAACTGGGRPAIVLERAGAHAKQGLASTFRTGVGFGLWQALAVTTNKPVHLVAPAVWKRHAGLIGCDKAASRLRAAERFPEVGRLEPADEGPAEALLMAAWLADQDGAARRTPAAAGAAR